jgi:hypothetical protein
MDAVKTGDVPTQEGGGGGSAYKADLVTEESFIPTDRLAFIESPFGQRYVSKKSRSMSSKDTQVRVQMWGFSSRMYHKYGTITNELSDQYGAETLQQDWYSLVRDMGKRSLKYKHLPTTLTDTDMLIYWQDAYFALVANLVMLLNLNRLAQYSAGMSLLTGTLPQYMSRITRLYRRASALSAPDWLKAHAVRSGLIAYYPNISGPVVRVWTTSGLLATGDGGPTQTTITQYYTSLFIKATAPTYFPLFVANLEAIERWLEVGTATVLDDFVAVRDLIDMTYDVVPGSFTTGLPKVSDLPGIVPNKALLNDIYMRALLWKDDVDAGTDQWGCFPIPGASELGGRYPVVGWGAPSIYEFTQLGAAKFGQFNSNTLKSDDVDSDFMYHGSDICLGGRNICDDDANMDMREGFGHLEGSTQPDDAIMNNVAHKFQQKMIDWNDADSIREWLRNDGFWVRHAWMHLGPELRETWGSGAYEEWLRNIDEVKSDYIFWADAEDMGLNTTQFIASKLGVPYLG